MTEHEPSIDARLARLRQRRGGSELVEGSTMGAATAPARHRNRRHPARNSRIVAAGLGAGAMFGIVTLLGLAGRTTQAGAADEGTPPPPIDSVAVAPPVKIVIHRVPSTTIDDGGLSADPVGRSAPIELTANPVVRTVTVSAPASSGTRVATAVPTPQQAPTATTSGSS